jgi:hypothetical protein
MSRKNRQNNNTTNTGIAPVGIVEDEFIRVQASNKDSAISLMQEVASCKVIDVGIYEVLDEIDQVFLVIKIGQGQLYLNHLNIGLRLP